DQRRHEAEKRELAAPRLTKVEFEQAQVLALVHERGHRDAWVPEDRLELRRREPEARAPQPHFADAPKQLPVPSGGRSSDPADVPATVLGNGPRCGRSEHAQMGDHGHRLPGGYLKAAVGELEGHSRASPFSANAAALSERARWQFRGEGW